MSEARAYAESSRDLDRLSFRASAATLTGLTVAVGLSTLCVSVPLPESVWGVATISALLVFVLASFTAVGSLAREHRRSVGRWAVVLLARTWLLVGTSLVVTWGVVLRSPARQAIRPKLEWTRRSSPSTEGLNCASSSPSICPTEQPLKHATGQR